MIKLNPSLAEYQLDPQFKEVAEYIIKTQKASATLIQRHFKFGYARSARLLDELEHIGVVGPVSGANPRKILINNLDDLYGTNLQIKGEEKIESDKDFKWIRTKYADYKSDKFEFELGVTENGKAVSVDMEKYGNLLVIGSQFTSAVDLLNNFLATTLSKYSPHELKLIVIDGKRGDLVSINRSPHLLTPVIVEPEKSISAFKWLQMEIERRASGQNDKTLKILLLISSYNQVSIFSPTETQDCFGQLVSQSRAQNIFIVFGMDCPDPKMPKNIIANIPAKVVFKPTDKKIARETGIPESIELSSPDEAILETMYEGKRKLTINKVDPKEIYEEIFS